MLPNDVARCDGKDWPAFGVQPECIECLRRTTGPASDWQPWMEPPKESPCPMRIAEDGK